MTTGIFLAMRITGAPRAVLPAILFLAVGLIHAAEAEERLTVVELFTSQGCSSCPPADNYLGELTKRDDVLALSFHVDYWDYIGWRDPYADAANSRRQRAYSERLGIPYVFTPQMVIDGVMEESGNNHLRIARLIAVAAAHDKPWADVRLTRAAARQVRVQVPSMAYSGEADVLLIRFDARHVTQVGGGENSGRVLSNHNVVRQVRPIATWGGEALDLTIPLEDLGGAGEDFCAVIVQESHQGRILGATFIDLRHTAS
ncbi:MAG: DUF1223 domain-containing protein [Alphaproteobacteria bacterium]